ncbi:MAG: oligosaccharide flippase family protein [Chloroflexota bacterium]
MGWGLVAPRTGNLADEDVSAATHFTLTLILTALWAAVLIAATLLLTEGVLQSSLIALTLVYAGLHLTDTPRFILTRRVDHRRLALIDIAETLLASAVAIALALRGATIGALVATDVIALLVAIVGLYILQPIWQPRLLWARDTMRYYLQFGSRNFAGIALGAAIDRVDDIWTGAVLGPTALGFYSRAYTFATYPRRILAYPVHSVSSGTMAELKDDRLALSKTFFRTQRFTCT